MVWPGTDAWAPCGVTAHGWLLLGQRGRADGNAWTPRNTAEGQRCDSPTRRGVRLLHPHSTLTAGDRGPHVLGANHTGSAHLVSAASALSWTGCSEHPADGPRSQSQGGEQLGGKQAGTAVAGHFEWLKMSLSCQDGVYVKPGCETPLSKSRLRVLTGGRPPEAPDRRAPPRAPLQVEPPPWQSRGLQRAAPGHPPEGAGAPGVAVSCDDRTLRADRERA